MKLLFLKNDFVGYDYVEPYGGGASVALSLLFEGFAGRVHINDIDRGVFAFWSAVLEDTDTLCRRIRGARLSVHEWHRQRKVQLAENPDPLDLAFSTFFLNRTNRSGIISAGVIGGQSQSGQWRLDARFEVVDLARRVERVAEYRDRISVTGLDALELLGTRVQQMPVSTFAYLDPPYFVKGQQLYANAYEESDHKQIAIALRTVPCKWLVSYDYHHRISALYRERRQLTYSLSYSAAARYRGKEVLIFGPGVRAPFSRSPANVRLSAVEKFEFSQLVA